MTAVDGVTGLKEVAELKPDLVLLDLLLPGMDGFEVLENIKKNKDLEKVQVVILSNLWQKEDVDRAMKLGAMDYWVKINFVSEEISAKIKNILH